MGFNSAFKGLTHVAQLDESRLRNHCCHGKTI